MKKKTFNNISNKSGFLSDLYENKFSANQYVHRLAEISSSLYEWNGLPDGIDPRYLEMCLFFKGYCCFFYDKELAEFLALQCTIGGTLSVYNIPNSREAYAPNGYHKKLTEKDSVLIFNNYLHTPAYPDCYEFAKKLYNLDMTIETNLNGQKTPILLMCDEKQRLTLQNMYAKYETNSKVIVANNDLNPQQIQCLHTDTPFLADRLYDMKSNIWNEALTYLGISNISIDKKERLITDEVTRSQGGIIANRFARLQARQIACDQINKMFGLNVTCEFREQDFGGTFNKQEVKTNE